MARSDSTSRDVSGPGGLGDEGVLLVAGEGVLTTCSVRRGELVIGRDAACDIAIPHRSLSRRHAILRAGDELTVQDLGSTNGTRVRGELLRGGDPRPIEAGESFHVGGLSFLLLRGPRRGATAPTAAGEAIRVRDLGTRTGTFVGAVRVNDAVVPPATRVRIGRTVLSVGLPPPTGDVRARLAAEGLVFAGAAMGEVAESLRKLAPFAMSVLVEGETGTGKEVVARAIHALSMRNNGPFVFVDCGALPPSLVESELFGHERGAFTSAEGQRAGAFEMAHGGTLFLDEIGELPRESQAALLGVLSRRRSAPVKAPRS